MGQNLFLIPLAIDRSLKKKWLPRSHSIREVHTLNKIASYIITIFPQKRGKTQNPKKNPDQKFPSWKKTPPNFSKNWISLKRFRIFGACSLLLSVHIGHQWNLLLWNGTKFGQSRFLKLAFKLHQMPLCYCIYVTLLLCLWTYFINKYVLNFGSSILACGTWSWNNNLLLLLC